MPLLLEKTLGDIRQSVAVRCGVAQSGQAANRSKNILDELVNKCMREIYLSCYWARLRVTQDYPLTSSQQDYDIPDDFPIGGINRITVLGTDGREYQLAYDDLVELQDIAYDAMNRPLYFRFVNGILRLYPAPDATQWPTMRIDGTMGPVWMVNDADRSAVDSEAVTQLTVINYKQYLGIGGDQGPAKQDFINYLHNLRQLVSPARTYNIASRWEDGPAYWKWPSLDTYTLPWANGDWNPPGAGW